MTEPSFKAQQPQWHPWPGQQGGEDRDLPASAGDVAEKTLAAARLPARHVSPFAYSVCVLFPLKGAGCANSPLPAGAWMCSAEHSP